MDSGMSGVELVIFDCDGVLVDSEVLSHRALAASLAEHGITISPDDFAGKFLGRSFPKVAADIRADHGIPLPPSFEDSYRARLFATFAKALRPTPGLEAMLGGFDLPACVATSSTPVRAARALQICGLDRRFADRVFTASEVANGKPAPDLFLHAARTLGADPARCLVIEDSLPGLIAARAAGMPVWRYTGGAHLRGRALADTPQGVPEIDDWTVFSTRLAALTRHGLAGGARA